MKIEGTALAVIASAAVAACVGSVGDDAATGANAPGGPQSALQPQSPNAIVAPAHARRLSVTEIHNSMRDLFALDDASVPFLPSESTPGQFDNRYNVLSVSPTFAGALQDVAEAVAARVVAKLSTLLPCSVGISAAAEPTCASSFVETYGVRAYRRPLTKDERANLVSVFTSTRADEDFVTSIATTVEALLQSPNFLFRAELGGVAAKAAPLSTYEIASALSYFLWQSLPDGPLLDAAASGKLATRDDVKVQAQRMIGDVRAVPAARAMFQQWLAVTPESAVTKTDAAYTADVAASMRAEVATFLEKTIWTSAHAYKDLLTSSASFVDNQVAPFYGLPAPATSGFVATNLDPTQRAGFLTMPGFVAAHTPGRDRSPIQLGHFVRSALFCQMLPAPPPGVPPAPNDPDLDVHARYARHATDAKCKGCHNMMDPIGYGWSQFDVVGRHTPVDHGVTEDGKGELSGTDVDGIFTGPVELAKKIAGSESAQNCYVGTVLRWALGRDTTVLDPKSADGVAVQAARGAGFPEGSVADLLVTIATTDAFLFRDTTAVPPGGAQ